MPEFNSGCSRGAKTPADAALPVKRYEGSRSSGEVFVTVDGSALDPRFDLRLHSPNGFEWGYGGSGPTQLALALLADCLGDDRKALAHYQEFKREVVAGLPHDGWTLGEQQVREALCAILLKV